MTEPLETPQEHESTGDGELSDEMLDEVGGGMGSMAANAGPGASGFSSPW